MKSKLIVALLVAVFSTGVMAVKVPGNEVIVESANVQHFGVEVTQDAERCTLAFSWGMKPKAGWADGPLDKHILSRNEPCEVLEKAGLIERSSLGWKPSKMALTSWKQGPDAVTGNVRERIEIAERDKK